ncbi:MAG TPA: polyprenyl synthetase family protein [Baekduia sp.]|nr:polyprenyl synthetase family protein [Baekduia sp.]
MSYSLLAPGKRVRPVLALATAEALKLDPQVVLPLAAALELIHTYSLIHDDLPAMDDDDLRRGRPTCHIKFGEDVAILAGDALYAEAFAHLLAQQQTLAGGADGLLTCARELAAATGVDGMVGGQYLDVTGHTADEQQLAQVHALKTGKLISASVVCVQHLAGTAPDELARWRSFSEQLGMLFQVVDDILDVTASAEQTGKPQGSDAKLGKRTYVTERGVDGARQLAGELHVQARATLSSCAATGAPALEAITDYLAQRTS